MLRKLITLCTVLACTLCSAAGQEGDSFEKMGWQKLQALESPLSVKQEVGSQTPIPLLTIENPPINLPKHLIAGELRYSNVEGTGFIEMWTTYADGNRYFSRTMGDTGPMATLEGSSDWRPVMLPFNGESGKVPTKLEVNAIIPDGGEVELRNLTLYQTESKAWWSGQSAAKFGAIGGTCIGLLGGLCGALAAFGKGRRFVLTILLANLVIGTILLIIGLYAVISKQPYLVYFPLLLIGGVLTVSGGMAFPTAKRAYTARELRRISAAG